jgi:hypothetical protein
MKPVETALLLKQVPDAAAALAPEIGPLPYILDRRLQSRYGRGRERKYLLPFENPIRSRILMT